jgi:hypothetical protein
VDEAQLRSVSCKVIRTPDCTQARSHAGSTSAAGKENSARSSKEGNGRKSQNDADPDFLLLLVFSVA